MKKLLKFSEFLKESLFINEGKGQQIQKNGVVAYKASTSKTRVTPKLATELGVEKDAIYQIDMNSIGYILDITGGIPEGTKGANWASLIQTPKFGYTIKKVGKTAKPGLDVLTINGNPVIPGPDGLLISPSDFKEGGKNTISAANNGILALTRLSRAMNAALRTSTLKGGKISTGLSKDWSIQLSIGGNQQSTESRGYKYFYAVPGSFGPARNTILNSIAVAAVRAYYNKGEKLSITFPDYTKQPQSWWTDKICKATEGKSSREEIVNLEITTLNEIIDLIRNMLLKENNLVNQTPIDISNEWKGFTSNIDSYMTKTGDPKAGKFIMSLTPSGVKAVSDLMKSIANKISDTTMPSDIEMTQSVLATLISTTFSELSMVSNIRINESVKEAQILNKYGPTSSIVALSGSSAVRQAEGGY
jgi:hypothetical protein